MSRLESLFVGVNRLKYCETVISKPRRWEENSRHQIAKFPLFRPSSGVQYSAAHQIAEYQLAAVDVPVDQDVLGGSIIALLIAFGLSFLQSTSSNNTNFVLWRDSEGVADRMIQPQRFESNAKEERLSSPETASSENVEKISEVRENVFNAQSWEEMAKPENYVWYNSKMRERDTFRADSSSDRATGILEKRWVLVGLISLFVPVFSFEFFLALSRQFMCEGDIFTQPAWSHDLCSPH